MPPFMPEFPQFSLLPTELRCQIWTFILPAPRLVEIRAVTGHVRISDEECASPSSSSSSPPSLPFTHIWTPKSPVPSLLQISQESRAVGLMHYSLTFDSNPRPSLECLSRSITALNLSSQTRAQLQLGIPFSTPAPIYCSLSRDVLVPRKDGLHYESMPILASERGFEHVVFRSLAPSILQNIRYLVMPCMPFQAQDYQEMVSYFKTLTGLEGLVVAEVGLNDGNRSTWSRRVTKELRTYSTRRDAKVRTILELKMLEKAVLEEKVWEPGVVMEWD